MKLATRLEEYLDDQNIPFETMVHPPAFCATKLAKYLHIPGHLVAKSVLLVSPTKFILAVLPATHEVDLGALSHCLGESVRLAREEEVAELFLDCERGSLTPFGRLYGMNTLLDDAFRPNVAMVFEAQLHSVAIRMLCRDFERLEQPRRCNFARPIHNN